MKQLIMALGLVVVAACGNKVDGIIKEMDSFKDKMCACKDAACADKVNDEHKAWEKSMQEKFSKDDFKNLSEDQKKKGDEVEKGYRDCRRKLRDGAATAPAPTEPAPAAPAPAAPAAPAETK